MLLLASTARAAFLTALTPDEQAQCGLGQLSSGQAAKLDQLIERDERFAQEGGVAAFAKTFSARLTAADYAATGLSHLTNEQRSRLDDLVAFRIAHPLPQPPHFQGQVLTSSDPAATRPPAAAVTPAPSAVLPAWHPEIHGDVSMSIGGGKGGSFYGGGMDLVVTDPSGKFTLAAGFYEYHVKGRMSPMLCPPGPVLEEDPALGADGLPIGLPRL